MRDQKIQFGGFKNNRPEYDDVFSEIEKELEDKLWDLFDKEKERRQKNPSAKNFEEFFN